MDPGELAGDIGCAVARRGGRKGGKGAADGWGPGVGERRQRACGPGVRGGACGRAASGRWTRGAGVERAALGEQARAGREKGWAAPGRAGRKEVRDGLGHAELGQAEACAGRAGRPSGVASWAGRVGLDLASLGCFGFGSSSLYISLFYFYLSLKLNYLNSKEILNSNPYEIKQLKQCISMNASTKLNLRKI